MITHHALATNNTTGRARKLTLARVAAIAALCAASALPAAPRQHPSKAIRVIVLPAPGSAPDVVTRILSNEFTALLGQR